jgi:thymidylate kinase
MRHTLPSVFVPGTPAHVIAARAEIPDLEDQVDRATLQAALAAHLPCIEESLFDACRRSLDADCPRWRRVVAGWTLRRRLSPYARRPTWTTRFIRVAATVLRRVGLARVLPRSRLADGGTVVALVGPDGAGKSTCTRALGKWLSAHMATMTAHLGRPPRSALTMFVGGLALIARRVRPPRPRRFPGYLVLLRILCTARDRYRLYARAQRFAAAGGIALCERYPVPPHRLLAGPGIGRYLTALPQRPLARLMHQAELALYRRMLSPDALLVLRVDPDVAVERKTDEPADYVRARANVMWNADWSGTAARVVDADRPFADVLTDLKARVWAGL